MGENPILTAWEHGTTRHKNEFVKHVLDDSLGSLKKDPSKFIGSICVILGMILRDDDQIKEAKAAAAANN